MTNTRPVLLGMNNPLSSDQRHALFPHPPGCTGHRIYELLRTRVPGVTRRQYLDAFDRRNLVAGVAWRMDLARENGARLRQELAGRHILVFGEEPRRALDLPKSLVHPLVELDGTTWRQLPHPSGRNLWYNDEKNRALAAALLAELYHLVVL